MRILLPEDKVENRGTHGIPRRSSGLCGDGINDACDHEGRVGVAMGVWVRAAIEAADVVLMGIPFENLSRPWG